MKRPLRELQIPDDLWGPLGQLAERLGIDRDALVRQALLGKEILTPGPSAEHFFLSLLLGNPKEFPPPATAGMEPGVAFLKGKGEGSVSTSVRRSTVMWVRGKVIRCKKSSFCIHIFLFCRWIIQLLGTFRCCP